MSVTGVPSYGLSTREPAPPQVISVNISELEEAKPVRRITPVIIWVVGLLLIGGALGLIIGLISPSFHFSNGTTSGMTNNDFSNAASTSVNPINTFATANTFATPNTIATSNTFATPNTVVTAAASTISTTAACASGYSRAPSGICVNLLLDFNNCGSFGFVCSSNYTSCSAGVCSGAPPVQIVGGVSIPGWGGSFSMDDAYMTLNLPVALTLYNYSSSSVSVSTNGVVCLSSCSADYSNGNLPTTSFGGPTALGYWDDLMVYAYTSQSVYYNVVGTTPNRTTTFEFYEAHFSQPNLYYRFQIIFYENLPNIVRYVYFQASDGGATATIGVQASSSGPATTYSVNQANSVTTNMILTFNTNTGTYTG